MDKNIVILFIKRYLVVPLILLLTPIILVQIYLTAQNTIFGKGDLEKRYDTYSNCIDAAISNYPNDWGSPEYEEQINLCKIQFPLKKFYTKTTSNIRKCASLDCDVIGQYPINSELQFRYQGIDQVPEWIEFIALNEQGKEITGYINKVVFSESLSSNAPKIITEKIKAPIATSYSEPDSLVSSVDVSGKEINSEPDFFASPQDISSKEINIENIVKIKCIHRSQYYKDSRYPSYYEEVEPGGTGVIISSSGYILTARHVLEHLTPNDPAKRIWTIQGCKAIITDKNQTPVNQLSDEGFYDANIIFKTSDEEYKNGNGLDFAILKINIEKPLEYATPFPRLVDFKIGDEVVVSGYPQIFDQYIKLERLDLTTKLTNDGEIGRNLGYMIGNESCNNFDVIPCGFRYAFIRDTYKFQKDFYKKTDLGIISSFSRGGFSGGPTFYKGNLIGIVTHGTSGDERTFTPDKISVLNSYEILEVLKKHSVSIE